MAFRWLNRQGVESTDGFILQSIDRYGYEYQESGHVLRVDVESLRDLTGTYSEDVYEDSFRRWLAPHESEALSEDDIVRLKTNVSAALTFMQIKHRFRQS
jgi:hypothetical protein